MPSHKSGAPLRCLPKNHSWLFILSDANDLLFARCQGNVNNELLPRTTPTAYDAA